MALKEELLKAGNWLFRWRSYLPLFLAALFLLAFVNFTYPYSNPILEKLWELFCFVISLCGIAIRFITIGQVPIGTSGRNTRKQIASSLNREGMYSIVRNPLYLGNSLVLLGISLFIRLWWFTIIIMLVFWLYYERIIFAEEEFLDESFGDSFKEWAGKTPAFIPKFNNWVKPTLPFSYKTAIKREYSTLFMIISVFFSLKVFADLIVNGRIIFDLTWTIIFGAGLALYLILRTIKKRTTWLHVEGR